MDDESSDFDWQTDSEEGWELTTRRQSPGLSIQRRKWQFFILGSLLIILLSTVTGSILFLSQRANRTEERMIAEVLSSHTLLVRAIEENDYELFSELLSSRNMAWGSLQEDLLRRQIVLGRTSFGLLKPQAMNFEGANLAQSVQLGAELQTAEVVDQVAYWTASDDHPTQTVSFEMVFHYQREGPSWKYTSPPDDEAYWGNWSHIEMENINLVLPQRDEDFGQKISKELDSLIGDLCSETEIICPPDFHLQLKLDRQPRSLLRLGDSFEGDQVQAVSGQYLLVLPAPTLIGRPIDDTSYEALYKSYAGWVAAVIMNNLLSEDHTSNDHFLDQYLSEKGLRAPLAPDRILPRAAEVTLQDVNTRPDQDILMLCSASQQLDLWRYDPIHNRWSDELAEVAKDVFGGPPANSEAILHRSPEVDGVLLTLHQLEEGGSRWRTYLWRDQISHLLLDEKSPYFYWPSLFFSWFNQSQGRIIVFRPTIDEPGRDSLAVRWYDINECLNSMCELQFIEGIPYWSPDDQYSIIFQGFDSDSFTLSLGDERGQFLHELGEGFPVGWLDENHFAYLLMSTDSLDSSRIDGFDELVVTNISSQGGENDNVETIVKASELWETLVGEGLSDQMKIESALAVEGKKNEWIIVASNPEGNDDSMYYVLKHYSSENTTKLVTINEGTNSFPVLLGQRAGNLAITWWDENGMNFKIIDIGDEQLLWHDSAIPYDWSDDGEWLLFVEQSSLRLVAPESRQEIVIPYDLRGCYSAVWTDRVQQ